MTLLFMVMLLAAACVVAEKSNLRHRDMKEGVLEDPVELFPASFFESMEEDDEYDEDLIVPLIDFDADDEFPIGDDEDSWSEDDDMEMTWTDWSSDEEPAASAQTEEAPLREARRLDVPTSAALKSLRLGSGTNGQITQYVSTEEVPTGDGEYSQGSGRNVVPHVTSKAEKPHNEEYDYFIEGSKSLLCCI